MISTSAAQWSSVAQPTFTAEPFVGVMDARPQWQPPAAPCARDRRREAGTGTRRLRGWAERIRQVQVVFVGHPDFETPQVRRELLADGGRGTCRDGAAEPRGTSAYVAALYRTPLLAREEEAALFRRMNGLKSLACRVQQRIDPRAPRADDLEQFERLIEGARRVRNQIIESNLRLVYSLAKRFAGTDPEEFSECVAEGNIALMRAVEHFDFSRGHRFSTYAHHAIRRQLLQRVQAEVRRRERFVAGGEEAAAALDRDEGGAIRDAQRLLLARQAVRDLLPCLSDRERTVIEVRFGLGKRRETFEELGRRMGVSKERVRQLQARALRKMAETARENHVALTWAES